MKLLTTAAVAATLAFAAPALATCNLCGDMAVGQVSGAVTSHSTSGGLAATGGLAFGGMDGYSRVENFSGAMNSSGVSGGLTFNELDGHIWEDNRNGGVLTSVDGIEVDVTLDTFSLSEQVSETRVIDNGLGTVGVGSGLGLSGGSAFGHGGFVALGSERW